MLTVKYSTSSFSASVRIGTEIGWLVPLAVPLVKVSVPETGV